METLYAAEMPEPDTGSIRDDLAASYRAVLTFVNTPEGEAYLRTSIAESVRDERIAALYRVPRPSGASSSPARRSSGPSPAARCAPTSTWTARSSGWEASWRSARSRTGRCRRVDEADGLVEFTLRGIEVR